jgi:hypothetical protein
MSKPKFAWTWADYERELAKDERRAARAAAKAKQVTVADSETATRARPLPKRARCEGEAPEGSSGAATTEDLPANASQARPLVSRPAPSVDEGRASRPIDASTARPVGSVGFARVERARAPRDIDRLRRALAASAEAAKAERARRPAVLPIAMSREECPSCGIPGFKGCEHQAPYQEPGEHERAYDYKRAG